MEIFKLLQKKSNFFYAQLVFLGLINSIWSGALLIFINSKISNSRIPFFEDYSEFLFIILILLSFLTSKYFQGYMIRLTYELGNDIGLSIFDNLRFSKYENYLRFGEDKVRAIMSDVVVLQRFPISFIEVFNAFIMVIIGIGYLLYTNIYGALLLIFMIVVLSTIYFIRNTTIEKGLTKVRDLANIYFQNVNDFLLGFREIKMDINRNDRIFNNYLSKNRNEVKDITIKTLKSQMLNELIGSYSTYLIIGLIIFVVPLMTQMSIVDNSMFLVTLLYLMGPLGVLIVQLHEFTKIKVSILRIEEFNKSIRKNEEIGLMHGFPLSNDDTEPFKKIEFKNVTYDYKINNESFKIEPFSLEIKKGEMIFVVGGNGSGKSTFVKLLTGLLEPNSGNILYNNRILKEDQYPHYRNKITAIYADHYLFSNNYNDFKLNDSNADFLDLVTWMRLEKVLKLDPERNYFNTNLSSGQKKRVALICGLLEGKEIIVLDEWAAEQDPNFREFFYRNILPELKKMGKTLIVVTHDYTFLDAADRILQFNYGKLSENYSVHLD